VSKGTETRLHASVSSKIFPGYTPDSVPKGGEEGKWEDRIRKSGSKGMARKENEKEGMELGGAKREDSEGWCPS
jgi:hypothetical protein